MDEAVGFIAIFFLEAARWLVYTYVFGFIILLSIVLMHWLDSL